MLAVSAVTIVGMGALAGAPVPVAGSRAAAAPGGLAPAADCSPATGPKSGTTGSGSPGGPRATARVGDVTPDDPIGPPVPFARTDPGRPALASTVDCSGDDGGGGDGSGNTLVIVLSSVGGIALLVLVAALVARRRRPEPPWPSYSAYPNQSLYPDQSGYPSHPGYPSHAHQPSPAHQPSHPGYPSHPGGTGYLGQPSYHDQAGAPPSWRNGAQPGPPLSG